MSGVLKRLATTDELERLNDAASDQPLADATEDELKDALRYVFMVCGLRGENLPAGDDKDFLHLYIRKFYGNHTGAEVRLAFDMAIQGKLDVDAKTYENFSVEYFARIMNAFRKAAAKAKKKPAEITPGPPPPSAEHLAQIDREYADYLIVLACERRAMIDKLPSTMENLKQYAKRNLKR